jgi:hypothetical protein
MAKVNRINLSLVELKNHLRIPFKFICKEKLWLQIITPIVVVFLCACQSQEDATMTRLLKKGPIRVAVLGDSDSHAYNDRVNGVRRGGEYYLCTYQWTDILSDLRAEDFDFGEKGIWGTRRRYAIMKEWLGLESSTPRKYDYRYNYALSGLGCSSLLTEWPEQARWAIDQIKGDQSHWDNGIVVIKIGINDLGQLHHLEEYAKTGLTPDVRQRVKACINYIATAVKRIRKASTTVHIVLYGIMDNSKFPLPSEVSFDPKQLEMIRSVLDLFDTGLRELAERDSNTVVVDDRIWVDHYWPNVGIAPNLNLTQVFLGGSIGVSNTKGDHPRNIMLQDGHAGTISNGLWSRELIHRLNDSFGYGISPLLDGEIAALADPDGVLGIAPSLPDVLQPPTLDLYFGDINVNWCQLPLKLPAFNARDSQNSDIVSSATAWCDDQKGHRLWLFGDGRDLELRPERFAKGTYRLTVSVRDCWGQKAERSVWLVISSS